MTLQLAEIACLLCSTSFGYLVRLGDEHKVVPGAHRLNAARR